jgi:diaminohydroxyphosphoribosylaminopyrimidine deaminase / 5-amino-6-(5-phosphoribosylamino)uracil reductase
VSAREYMNIDSDFMQRCFQLAELGRFTCRPNPAVGAIIAKGTQVLGEGWHQIAGQAHAEIHALQQAGEQARGATVYVSLEPCAHQGRTGPCADALVKAGVATVVYGMRDPNPLVAGKGLQILQNAGIEVRGPVLEEQARWVNPGFNKRMATGLPWVRCKLGMSLDGRSAMASGESQWITGPEAREDVQRWRARSCAILTGIGTVLADNPRLDVRLPDYHGQQPLRVVLDSRARMPASLRLFDSPGQVLQATTGMDAGSIGEKAVVLSLPGAKGRVDLQALLQLLARDFHCNEVLVEAGPELSGALLGAGLVDELITYIAPSLLGHEARPMALLPGLERLSQRIELHFLDVAMLGKDCRIRSLFGSMNPTP